MKLVLPSSLLYVPAAHLHGQFLSFRYDFTTINSQSDRISGALLVVNRYCRITIAVRQKLAIQMCGWHVK